MKDIGNEQRSDELLVNQDKTLMDFNLHQSIVNSDLRDIKRDSGMFFTPEWIVDLMVNLIDDTNYVEKECIKILEPACGLAQFLLGIKRNKPSLFSQAKLFGVEINQEIINYLSNLKIANAIDLNRADFLLWQTRSYYDLIIGNPPYGIPSLSEHYTIKTNPATKEKYKKLYATWFGKYNVYGAFIEKSINLLKDNGQLIFIVPPTFMILDEFKKLRVFLAQNGKTEIIYLGADIFKPEADVSSVVLNFIKSDKYISRLELKEFQDNKIRTLKSNFHWKGEVVKFDTDYTQTLESLCPYRLGDIYNIRISPRTPEIKRSNIIVKEKAPGENDYLPLLNGKNLKCNMINYNNLTGYWVKKQDVNKIRMYFGYPHIVVGLGFRENGKVAAAFDEKCYPWMGDVYHLVRENSLFNCHFDLETEEVVAYLNSDYIKKYVKDTYREITYHLSITQLKNLPVPDKNTLQLIKKENLCE
jgi:adenine-specific DNA-methyltransferase